jgi:protein-arginine kinase activator protein McsA
MKVLKRRYCFNCRENLATVRVVNGDLTEYVCDECFDKRPEGWEADETWKS